MSWISFHKSRTCFLNPWTCFSNPWTYCFLHVSRGVKVMSYIVRRYKVGIKRFRKHDNSYTRTNFITTSPRERSDPNLITNKFRNPAKHELFQMKGLFSDPFLRSPTQPTSPLDFTICSQIAQSSFHFVGQLVTRLSDL